MLHKQEGFSDKRALVHLKLITPEINFAEKYLVFDSSESIVPGLENRPKIVSTLILSQHLSTFWFSGELSLRSTIVLNRYYNRKWPDIVEFNVF